MLIVLVLNLIAAYFVEQKAEGDVAGRLDQIMERLDHLEARLLAGHDDEAVEEQVRR